jgi:hypothetical protein
MILRRFMSHVSDQNWFAVGLDFVVVVVGIVLGLQFTQWNDDRQDRVWEQLFYRELLADLGRDAEHLDIIIEAQAGKGNRMRAAVTKLQRNEELSVDEYWAARYGSPTFFPAVGVFESALSSGKIELIRDRSLRYRIMNLYGHHYERADHNGELYDERVVISAWESRHYFDSYNREFIRWDDEVKQSLRAEFTFLIRENEIYLEVIDGLEKELAEIILILAEKK